MYEFITLQQKIAVHDKAVTLAVQMGNSVLKIGKRNDLLLEEEDELQSILLITYITCIALKMNSV